MLLMLLVFLLQSRFECFKKSLV